MASVPAARTVWLWAGHAAYLGPSFQLDAHSTPVQCFALGVDAPFTVTVGERTWSRRSALIPARTVHRLDAGAGRMLFCYTDPRSVHADLLRSAMRDTAPIAGDHRNEQALIDRLRDGEIGPDELDRLLLAGGAPRDIDPRIRQAMDAIIGDPAEFGAERLAADAGLSTSRFLHLFSAGAGTSFRRYRLWARMLSVAAAVSESRDLTDAAVDAGFASPSHFSDAFRTMFGLTATTLLAQGTTVIVGGSQS
ncbi:AraC-like DNA-binding protein [Nocardia transvalensis]|uniref:AraC-like DNA-binding protein n=1 Tax=Nocardia transvalensis TaxID=37333 RepID=A0A7W9P901_9NOCA|nr:AraC family transcriptional regulator [Nocardia transvalensis]MBB5911706.1 AraC-like DNA-binding protein [Nocardia transvalensis]